MRARAPAALLVPALAALAACSLKSAPDHGELLRQALPETPIPPAWKADANAGPVAGDWLASLGDPQLEPLVAEALANNPDLRQAMERVTIAEQQLIVVGAQLLPQVGAKLGGRSTKIEDLDTSESTLAFARVAWELDVSGRLRAQRAAAEAQAQATVLDVAQARQSLAGATARAWYLAIETRQLLELAEQAVDIYRELLELVQVRRSAGKDTDLDVFDTRAKLESAQSQVQSAQELYGEARRALEVLLGRYPAAEIAVAADYPLLAAPPWADSPAALLERRPDVQAAEQDVLAAFRMEEAAQLALLPSAALTLEGGRFDDNALAVLDSNPWLASAGLGVSIPIYEGGALSAQVEIATARQAQAAARYGSVVLKAFLEVENALANERLIAARLPLDEDALDDRVASVRVATEQYRAGRQDLLWVSQLQADQLATQAELIKLRSLQRVNRIRLLLALGAGFDAAPADAPVGEPTPTGQ